VAGEADQGRRQVIGEKDRQNRQIVGRGTDYPQIVGKFSMTPIVRKPSEDRQRRHSTLAVLRRF
jgi:hypothetical protein